MQALGALGAVPTSLDAYSTFGTAYAYDCGLRQWFECLTTPGQALRHGMLVARHTTTALGLCSRALFDR